MSTPDYFAARTAVIVNPWWRGYFAARLADADGRQTTYRAILEHIREVRGALRYTVTLLAAINALPRDVRPIATRPGRRPMGMNLLPYLGHSHLTITLPRDDRVVWAHDILDRTLRNSGRRRHPVSGHWRIVERGKKAGFVCRHLPIMVEPGGLGMCERCEMLVRWIKPHERGDASLGIVEHHHTVTARRQPPEVELGRPPQEPGQ